MLLGRILSLLVVHFAVLMLTGCGFNCVVEGELVLTPKGERPIETLRVGDEVISRSPSGTFESGRITAIHAASTSQFREITFADGTSLRSTAGHKILTTQGWVKVADVRPGTRTVTDDGEIQIATIRSVRKRVRVFDLTVEPHSTYIASGIVVHNKSRARLISRDQLNGTWISADRAIIIRPDGTGLWLHRFMDKPTPGSPIDGIKKDERKSLWIAQTRLSDSSTESLGLQAWQARWGEQPNEMLVYYRPIGNRKPIGVWFRRIDDMEMWIEQVRERAEESDSDMQAP